MPQPPPPPGGYPVNFDSHRSSVSSVSSVSTISTSEVEADDFHTPALSLYSTFEIEDVENPMRLSISTPQRPSLYASASSSSSLPFDDTVHRESPKVKPKSTSTTDLDGPKKSCCGCNKNSRLFGYCYSDHKPTRWAARSFFLLSFLYFLWSILLTIDLLRLLKCEKASCDSACVTMDAADILSLSRTDNHLDFVTSATVNYPAYTAIGMGESNLLIYYEGKLLMDMKSSYPHIKHESDKPTPTWWWWGSQGDNIIRNGESTLYVNASGDLSNLVLGGKIFGKLMSEKAIELEIRVKAKVTTWAFTFFPLTLTMPTRSEAYTCRQINSSTVCDVGTLAQFEEQDCVLPGMYPVVDPIIHSIDFVSPLATDTPNTVTVSVNFTVLTGSTLDINTALPVDTELDAYFTDDLHPLSEAVRLPNTYQSIAKIRISEAVFEGKYMSGILELVVDGTEGRIEELKKMVSLLLDGDPEPQVLLYIQGTGDTGDTSFFQRILAVMPLIKMLDYPSFNLNTISDQFNLTSVVTPVEMRLLGLSPDEAAPDTSAVDVSLFGRFSLDIPYNMYGVAPGVSLVLLDPDDDTNTLVKVTITDCTLFGVFETAPPAQARMDVVVMELPRILELVTDGRVEEMRLGGTSASQYLISRVLEDESIDVSPIIEGVLGTHGTGVNGTSLDLDSFRVNASLTFNEDDPSGFQTLASVNVSNLPINFAIGCGALEVVMTDDEEQPFAMLSVSEVECESDEPCEVYSTVTLIPERTSALLTKFIEGTKVTISGYGTIDGKPNITLPDLTAPALPSTLSLANLTQLIDEDCDAASGLCFGNGFGRVENFDVLGATIEGGDIDIPCVFGEGLCREITPRQIQLLKPTSAAGGINLTLALNDTLPFLEYVVIEVPKMSLNVDVGGKADSVTLVVEPIEIDIMGWMEKTRIIFLGTAEINDWSAVFRAAYTFADDSGGEIVLHGAPDEGSKVSPVSSVFPRITVALDEEQFEFTFPDIPLPYSEEGNEAMPWQLVSTKQNEAKFLIGMDFDNPVPVALVFENVKVRVMYDDDNTNLPVEVASVSLPNDEFVLSTGNNSLVSFLTLNANNGNNEVEETCMKSECVDIDNLQGQLECVPCTSTKFLRSFLSRAETNVTVAVEFKNFFGEIITLRTTLTMYSETADAQVSKGRKEDFIDKVVDVESILSRAMFFELNFGQSIVDTLTPPWMDWAGEGALIKVDGALDITVDNIFTFSFTTRKLYINRVGMSDLEGVLKTYPFTHVPFVPFFGTSYDASDDAVACRNVADSSTTFVPSGEISGVIPVPIKGSLEALSRAVGELYVQGRFCLHITEAMADLSLQCEDALLAKYDLTCEEKEVFGLTMPWSMNDVSLYRKHACHNPGEATNGCVPTVSPMFSFNGGLSNFNAGQFEVAGDVKVETTKIILAEEKGEDGAVFLKQKVMVRDGWEASFQFKMSDDRAWQTDGEKSGGFAFVIQNGDQGPKEQGDRGSCDVTLDTEGLNDPALNAFTDTKTHVSCVGYKGIENSVGVLFSLKANQFYSILGISDWQRGSVSVWKNGAVESGSGSSTRTGVNVLGYAQVPDDDSSRPAKMQLDNFDSHTVRVVYNSVWRQLYVYLDDMDEVFLNAPVDLGQDIGLGDDGMAYVGFTSQMDYAYEQEITSFGMGRVVKDDSEARLVEDGQERSSPGKTGVFRVDARDSCGMPRTEGGESVAVDMRAAGGEWGAGVVVQGVVDMGDGLYEATYVCEEAGEWEVRANGVLAGVIVVA